MSHEWTKGPTREADGDTLYVSVPFTWNLPEVLREACQPHLFHKRIIIGGPAVKLAQARMPDMLAALPAWVTLGDEWPGALQRMNPYATRTTVGCVRGCSFCAVPITEGVFRELDDWPDLPIICDNNLLASSPGHFDRVCDRLERHSWCDFNQGLDARLLNAHHAERIGRLRRAQVRLALDHTSLMDEWSAAYELLRRFKVAKNRISTYVLCGHRSDPVDAWRRCQHVDKHSHPAALPQWYHPLDAIEHNAVLPCHTEYGWSMAERSRIMGYYYQHRGTALA